MYCHDELFMHSLGCLFPSVLSNSGNKHQNNPFLNAQIVHHSTPYIIPYILDLICENLFNPSRTENLSMYNQVGLNSTISSRNKH